MKKQLLIKQVFKDAWNVVWGKFGFFFFITLFYVAMSFLVGFFKGMIIHSNNSITIKIIGHILSFLCTSTLHLGFIKIGLDVFNKGKGLFRDFFTSIRFVPKYFVSFFILAVITLIPIFLTTFSLVFSKLNLSMNWLIVTSIINFSIYAILAILGLTVFMGIILEKEKFIRSTWFKFITLYFASIIAGLMFQKMAIFYNSLNYLPITTFSWPLVLLIISLAIPGIIFCIMFQFSTLFIIDKGVGPVKALKLSFLLTSNVKWKVFLVTLVCGLCIIVGLLMIIVGLFAAIPLTNMIIIVAYRYLLDQEGSKNVEDKELLEIQ